MSYKSIAVHTGCVTNLELYVDGQFARSVIFGCSGESNAKGVFKGYEESCTGDTTNPRAFTFGKMKTTSKWVNAKVKRWYNLAD